MTRILAFWGAPSSGKSAAAMMASGEMKARGISVELVPEFPKELVWDGSTERLKDQLFIFAEQNRRLYSLIGKVDWVVTDMALPITLPYIMLPDRCSAWDRDPETIQRWKSHFCDLVTETWGMYDTLDVHIERDVRYVHHGRIEDEKNSLIIAEKIRGDFDKYAKTPIYTTTSQYRNEIVRLMDDGVIS